MTFISFALAGVVGMLSYSIGYNTFRIRRRHPRMVRRVEGRAAAAGTTPVKAKTAIMPVARAAESAAAVAAPSVDEHRTVDLVGISPGE